MILEQGLTPDFRPYNFQPCELFCQFPCASLVKIYGNDVSSTTCTSVGKSVGTPAVRTLGSRFPRYREVVTIVNGGGESGGVGAGAGISRMIGGYLYNGGTAARARGRTDKESNEASGPGLRGGLRVFGE